MPALDKNSSELTKGDKVLIRATVRGVGGDGAAANLMVETDEGSSDYPAQFITLNSRQVELLKTEPVKAEPVKAEPVKAEPAKPEPVKAEPVKAEPAKPVELSAIESLSADESPPTDTAAPSGN